jgi:hypothetical protein
MLSATDEDGLASSRPARVLLGGLLVVLLFGAFVATARESARATTVPGTLVSVDKVDGGEGGAGLVTVRYVDGTGHPVTAQVVMNMGKWTSQDPGTPISVYVRNGLAVDEPDDFLPSLALSLVQAAIVWIVVLLAVLMVRHVRSERVVA